METTKDVIEVLTPEELKRLWEKGKEIGSALELDSKDFQELIYCKPEKESPYRVEVVRRDRGSRSFVYVEDIEPGFDPPKWNKVKDGAYRMGKNPQRGRVFQAHIKHLRKI
jgi:hypothetical protein